ncbi:MULTISPECIES: RnfH family protein [unclassified Pseudomonas]|uniref:RnfH family protein n=1 Tax=unclassified Pseudomonas TaxID=196821 RepID=UPI002AC8D4A2|nr:MULTISPECIES: RnfH family protein [unclassified Pseudomonas]MEB0040682.1 RnfH family protein [Pseudomonas sp. MH10]MEB0078581.1 RnfH family protein [Pseudomonas sp. MH10out]MEB0091623.1 RnfH family protein [Pseudomonas sp. CCI4.2]MEB0099974.1 RnfH family protein [Pseudomonas sp. CCI3.2]MEB0123068.1 RnfH family protein [Pseudomonas sp. CCI1.2]
MAEAMITIEVVYAAIDRQMLLSLDLPAGTTVRSGLFASGIGKHFPELDLMHCPVGIFGKVLSGADTHVLQAGDRIEIYRPLLADPKEIRRLRAAKAALAKSKGDTP